MFSQAEGFTTISTLWGPMAFHAVFTALGAYFIGRPSLKKAAAASAV